MRPDARRTADRLVAALVSLVVGSACSLAPREGLYACDPDARSPACPAGWTCHRSDSLCWPGAEDAGTEVADVIDVEPEVDGTGDTTDEVDGEDVGPDDAEACSGPERCNEIDDDCDGATDEEIWCAAAAVPSERDLYAVWCDSAEHVWVVGDRGTILFWNGDAWSAVESGTTANLRGVWSASADAAWTVGPTPTVLRWDGLSWTDDAPAVEWTPQDVWGTGPDDVWAVGGPGLVLHRSGGTWTEEPTGVVMGGRFFGVWGDPGVKVFTVGENSMIRDRELPAGSWNTRLPPEWMDLFAVVGASADLVWAVGGVGNILRGPGATWVRVGGPTTNDLRGVWALSSDAAWAVGDGGTIVQWNGAVWQEEESGTTAGLKGVWGAPAGELWAVGATGAILRRRL